jgi:signal transduction histidine kinase
MTITSEIAGPAGTRARRGFALGLVFCVLFLPVLISWLGPVPPERLHYTSAVAHIVFRDGIGEDAGTSRDVTLPDSWNQTRRGFGGLIEYSIALRPVDEAGEQSVLIERAKGNCDVILNDRVLYSEIDRKEHKGTNRVVFVPLPRDALRDNNRLLLRLRGYASDGSGISDVYVGPTNELRPAFTARWLVSEQLLTIANWSVVALCLPFVLIWLRDPRSSQTYGLFTAGALGFALRNFHRQIDPDLLAGPFWQPLISASLGWVALAEWLFLMRYVGVRVPRFERGMLIFVIVGSFVLFLVPTPLFAPVDAFAWRVPIFLSGILCVSAFTSIAFRNPTRPRILIAAGMFAQIAPALHDLLWLTGYIPFSAAQWFPLSFPALFVVMGLVLADDIATTRRALREANTDLERKVVAAREELNQMYERQRLQDAERFKLEERGRLMREMHDGVGTHLSLLLSGLQRGKLRDDEVRDAVQLSMDELRLLLDARSPSTETLVEAISNLRHRLESRLQLAGTSTSWHVDDRAEEAALSAEATLHVLRMVQECVTNAVRHGRASQIEYRIFFADAATGADLHIEISDNGCGPEGASPSTRGSGTGLANLRTRAAALGGRFELTRTGVRTVATITLPAAACRSVQTPQV